MNWTVHAKLRNCLTLGMCFLPFDVFGDSHVGLTKDDCATFRQGEIATLEIATYDDVPFSEREKTIKYISLRYGARYDFFGAPTPVGPPSSVSFILDYRTGQRLFDTKTLAPRRDTFISILLNGNSPGPLDKVLSIAANMPPIVSAVGDEIRGFQPAEYRVTGPRFENFSQIQFAKPEHVLFDKNVDYFVDLNSAAKLKAVMRCDKVGSVPNPSCEIFEKMGRLEMLTGYFRRNDLSSLAQIRAMSKKFVMCLTFREN